MTPAIEQVKNERRSPKKKKSKPSTPTMQQVDAIILGGGQGTRLHPLTLTRSKPATSFGGYYRIIDIAVSNAINSNCKKIYIITQFFSSSLHKHLYRTYRDDFFANGSIQLLTAEERPTKKGWFAGTADAVRQNLDYIKESFSDYFLILSGDQLYNINFEHMLKSAYESDADLTIASTPVTEEDSKRMGILQIDNNCTITGFVEKPKEPQLLSSFKMSPALVTHFQTHDKPFLASMGIYLFKRQALIDLLMSDDREDFGKHLIPAKVQEGKAAAFLYKGYWEDIGTIESFHQANMRLTLPNSPFNCYDDKWPLYCRHHNLSGPKVLNAKLKNAILCEGCIVDAEEITRTILGPRSVIKQGCIIRDTYMIGNDFYCPPKHTALPQNLWIDENTTIFNAIIDKHVQIGKNVQLTNKQQLVEYDSPNVYIRGGIIVVPRGAVIPNGFIL